MERPCYKGEREEALACTPEMLRDKPECCRMCTLGDTSCERPPAPREPKVPIVTPLVPGTPRTPRALKERGVALLKSDGWLAACRKSSKDESESVCVRMGEF